MSVNRYKTPIYLPGGIADRERNVGYFSHNSIGIVAIDLITGEILGSTDLATQPLITWRESLVAAGVSKTEQNSIQIVVLDSALGGAPVRSSPIVNFPEWAIPFGPDDSFSFKTGLDGDVLAIVWTARKLYRGGASPPRYVVEQANKSDGGEIRVDLRNGAVELRPLAEENEIDAPVPQRPGDDGLYETRSWKINDKNAALLMDLSDAAPSIWIKVWDSSTREIYIFTRLLQGDGLVAGVSLDGSYVLIHQEIPASAQNTVDIPWSIFSVETGLRVAALSYEENIKEAAVIDGVIFYSIEKRKSEVLQLILKAKEMETDKVLWVRIMGDHHPVTFQALPQ